MVMTRDWQHTKQNKTNEDKNPWNNDNDAVYAQMCLCVELNPSVQRDRSFDQVLYIFPIQVWLRLYFLFSFEYYNWIEKKIDYDFTVDPPYASDASVVRSFSGTQAANKSVKPAYIVPSPRPLSTRNTIKPFACAGYNH